MSYLTKPLTSSSAKRFLAFKEIQFESLNSPTISADRKWAVCRTFPFTYPLKWQSVTEHRRNVDAHFARVHGSHQRGIWLWLPPPTNIPRTRRTQHKALHRRRRLLWQYNGSTHSYQPLQSWWRWWYRRQRHSQ